MGPMKPFGFGIFTALYEFFINESDPQRRIFSAHKKQMFVLVRVRFPLAFLSITTVGKGNAKWTARQQNWPTVQTVSSDKVIDVLCIAEKLDAILSLTPVVRGVSGTSVATNHNHKGYQIDNAAHTQRPPYQPRQSHSFVAFMNNQMDKKTITTHPANASSGRSVSGGA